MRHVSFPDDVDDVILKLLEFAHICGLSSGRTVLGRMVCPDGEVYTLCRYDL